LKKAVTGSSHMPLFEFKLAVATALMYAENLPDPLGGAAAVLRDGGPAAAADLEDAVRLDGTNHWPEPMGKIPKCCRVKGCKLRSLIRCSKCKVFLCMKANSNCFLTYHTT